MEQSAKYIYEVYLCKSVSEAAKKLFVSQPALSSSIKKAEEQLGFCVFDRGTTPFTLTPEGRMYIESLEKIIAIENETQNRIRDISELKTGNLRFGSSSYVSSFAVPQMLGYFRKKHPNVSLQVVRSPVEELKSMMSGNYLDVILVYDTDNKNCSYIPIFDEHFIIAVHKSLLPENELLSKALTREEVLSWCFDEHKKIKDLSLFGNISFISNTASSSIYKKMKAVFDRCGFEPQFSATTNTLLMNYNLMRQKIGALFTSDIVVGTTFSDEDICYFVIEDADIKRTLYLCCRSEENATVNKIMSELGEIARELYPDGRYVFGR